MGLRPRQIAVLALLLVVGFALTAGLVAQERGAHRDTRQAWADRAATAVEAKVTSAGATLTGARGLLSASDSGVGRAIFERFAAVELEDSEMQSLNWAPRVTLAGRARYERASGRRIRDPTPAGVIGTAGTRREYFPVDLVAPRTLAAEATLGFDVAQDPRLLASLAATRDTGDPIMTPALTLDGDGVPRDVALVVAVYGPDPLPRTPQARRASLRGYTGGFFHISGLADSATQILPAGSRLQIVNEREAIFDSDTGAMPTEAPAAAIGDSGWSVRVAITQGGILTGLPVVLLAGGTLALVLLIGVIFAEGNQRGRERDRSRSQLEHEADTDGLTGLFNRRRLERDLDVAVAKATGDEPLAVMFLDLNGFKGYNDRFGHPAGDALLVRLAARLVVAVPGARVYRVGGDEFCVLAQLRPAALNEAIDLAVTALTDGGEGFAISAAYGVALVPDDAGSPDEAMLMADHRMYQRKALGRESAGRQTADVLIRAIAERTPDLDDHTRGVADLSYRVARRLGLDDTERSPVRRAALLHDVGKIAIPDAILDKPSSLDPDELDFIQRHTIIGERILRAAPALEAVAPIVRSSHERWDGSGYPDGLAGERIPLGSRIVFACDAFEAMTSTERPYRGAITVDAAIQELIGCAGTQFDPRVVEALVAVVREDSPEDVLSTRPAGGTTAETAVISGG